MSRCVKQNTKKYQNRPGPPFPANECKGLTKEGNDGLKYVAVPNIKGVYTWKLKAPKSSKKAVRKSKDYYNILFTEPYTFHMSKKLKGTIFGGSTFQVNAQFYKVLQRKPKKGKCKKPGPRNAYVFGKLFPLKQYKLIGSIMNDGAQAGLVDADQMMLNELPIDDYDTWIKIYKPYKYDWDNQKAFKEIKTVFPELLFVFYTVGGDVGCSLYAHYDKHKEIDGIILDNFCYFEEDEEESASI